MNRNLKTELQEHLDEEESLIWTGKPITGIVFRSSDIFLIPFSLLWLCSASLWMVGVSSAPGPFFLFGIPFILIGLLMAIGRFIIDSKQRANTTYGITENRILIKSGIFSKNIKSLNIKTLSDIELNEKGNGRGTIFIGPKNPHSFWGGMGWWPGMKPSPQFELIENARMVYNKIIEIQNNK